MIYTLKLAPRAVGWGPELWYVCNSDAAARRAHDMAPFVLTAWTDRSLLQL
jgi:hypothetical protein